MAAVSKISVLVLFLALTTTVSGQVSIGIDSNDHLRRSLEIKEILEKSMRSNVKSYLEQKAVTIQKKRLQHLVSYSEKVEMFFTRGIDTAGVRQKVNALENAFVAATSDASRNSEFVSYRNLTSTEYLLRELQKQLVSEKESVVDFGGKVDEIQLSLDSLVTDTALYVLPSDQAEMEIVLQTLAAIDAKLKVLDKEISAASDQSMYLNSRLNWLNNRLEVAIDSFDARGALVLKEFDKQDVPYFWQPFNPTHSSWDIIESSALRSRHVLYYFLSNNASSLVVMTVIYALLVYLGIWSRRSIKAQGRPSEYLQNFAFHNPTLSVLLVVLNIGQFFFITPPFVFQVVIWLFSIVVMIYFVVTKASNVNSKVLTLLIAFLIPVAMINLLLQPTGMERWLILTFSLLGLGVIYPIWKNRNNFRVQLPLFKFLLVIFAFCNFGALFSIVLGRFNLSKTLLAAAYFTMVSTIFLAWARLFVIHLLDITVAGFEASRYSRLREKVVKFHSQISRTMNALMYIGIVLLFLRNFYMYNLVMNYFGEFLSREFSIGEFSFSLNDIGAFVLVIAISAWLSNFVSFIFDDSQIGTTRGKGGLKNWALLIRLGIMIFGMLIAFAAAGIPMDKVTIILGGLGVGIGFGLQNIVNNLFSGVILAFERPIEIGDQIEVSGRVGKVHAIGIRSSKLQGFDGSEVIIPNGDLISQQVINWTLSHNNRRIDITIGVEYGTDLNKVKLILAQLVASNERVHKVPAPLVVVKEFADSSINIQMLFWTDVDSSLTVKSEVLLAIDAAFAENNIRMPYPHLDVHIDNPISRVVPTIQVKNIEKVNE